MALTNKEYSEDPSSYRKKNSSSSTLHVRSTRQVPQIPPTPSKASEVPRHRSSPLRRPTRPRQADKIRALRRFSRDSYPTQVQAMWGAFPLGLVKYPPPKFTAHSFITNFPTSSKFLVGKYRHNGKLRPIEKDVQKWTPFYSRQKCQLLVESHRKLLRKEDEQI